MIPVSRLYVDTNIFIMAFEGQNDRSRLLVHSLFVETVPSAFLATSLLTYAELLVAPLREQDKRLIDFYEALLDDGDMLVVMPVDRAVLRNAARLRARYKALKLPDAIHVASGMATACSHLLSDEARFPARFDLEFVAGRTVTIEVLRPDETTLMQIERIQA